MGGLPALAAGAAAASPLLLLRCLEAMSAVFNKQAKTPRTTARARTAVLLGLVSCACCTRTLTIRAHVCAPCMQEYVMEKKQQAKEAAAKQE